MSARSDREPRFLWTGLLILGPVVLLGVVALWQLRQDRAAAIAEARTEAEQQLEGSLALARELVTGENLRADGSARGSLAADTFQLRTPIPYPDIPVPGLEPSQQAVAMNALLDDNSKKPREKAEALADLSDGGGFTPAGLSVKQLALLRAIQIGEAAGTDRSQLKAWAVDLLRHVVREHPSSMAGRFLTVTEKYSDGTPECILSAERSTWNEHEIFRDFYREHAGSIESLAVSLRDQGTHNSRSEVARWIGPDSATYYCSIREGGANELTVNLVPLAGVAPLIGGLVLERKLIPPNCGLRLLVGGRVIFESGSADEAEMLASGAGSDAIAYAEIFLTDRAALLDPVRKRSQRTAWLIMLAVLAAGVGWFAAWRAFVRQRQLAAMKDNFVSAVSHELKAPIASIGLMAEELGSGSDKREEYTKLIAGECSRLGSLVENVLDYARIESGAENFEFEEADLGELARAAVELMRPAATERGMEIEIDAPPAGILTGVVDARAVGRALVNLLDNAIKYAPAESKITVAAAEGRISVTDQGVPIPAKERGQIFERFVRSGSEMTRETKGVGIGLSLVKHIAAAHGGRAWVESGADGNRFVFSFSNHTMDRSGGSPSPRMYERID